MTGLQLTRRQYYALCTMVLLSPLLHLVPRKTTAEAGCGGWLCALAALVPLLLFAWMLEGILHRGRPGEGIGEITLRALGPVAGRVLLGVYALWFLLYSAFALRIGAERFIETVFPLSRPWPFVVTILAMAVCGALGRTKALFRASEIFLPLLMLVLVLVLVFSLFFRIIQVDGESMVPTLQNGDKLIVWGAGYEPQRGDVVIVDSYTAYGKPLVKRVIAKGGDVVNIDYQAGTVSVNGEVLQEAYIAEPTYLGYDVTFPYTVPEGTVFVMGDNRNASLDSRSSYVGCIDERDILGKVLLCFLPFSDFGVVK